MNVILKGNFIYSDKNKKLIINENAYSICENGICKGIFKHIPQKYQKYKLIDYGDKIILPGLCDLHLHAPQYEFRATGMDCELLEWLNKYTFPIESKYKDISYAKVSYKKFVDDLKNSPTTRGVLFATIHNEATLELMRLLEQSGLQTYVGKVNMDRNSPEYYIEEDTQSAINDTQNWLENCNFTHTKPIITPRFTPTCTDELLLGLSQLQNQYNLNVQSHLSENQSEIEWVQELCPTAKHYGDSYHKFDMFGTKNKSIMAHCVLSVDEEVELMKENGVFVAHCPSSNVNLSSGIAPIRMYIDKNINVGLGTDIAGGHNLNLFDEMTLAIQLSKMYWRYVNRHCLPLTIADVFYMATRGGGNFFGNVGAFEDGFEFDAIIIDDSKLTTYQNLEQRLERLIYLSNECKLVGKFVQGRMIF